MPKKSIVILVVILVLAAVSAIVFFSGPKSNNNPPKESPAANVNNSPVAAGKVVKIENFAFTPPVLSIKAGEKVTWEHNDGAGHTIVSSGLFQSETLNRGQEFSFTFPAAGVYDYYCGIHPSMKGKIIVQ